MILISEKTGQNIRQESVGNAVYVDDSAAALLRNILPQLCNPADAGWAEVKHNPSRTVYRGAIAGQEIYLKHFHGRSMAGRFKSALGLSHAKREFRTACYLNSNGISAAPVLAVFDTSDGQWLATRAVSPAQAGDAWHLSQLAAGPTGRQAIRAATLALAEMVGKMHALGVIHDDLHCGNVMVQAAPNGEIKLVLMDLHRTKRRRHLSRRARAANLAQLLHDRFEWTLRTERLRFLKRYLQASGAEGSLRGWVILIDGFLRRHRARQYASSDKKIRRKNRYFSPISLPGGWRGRVVLASKYKLAGSRAVHIDFTEADWLAALGDIEALFKGPGVKVVKDSRSGIVVRTTLNIAGQSLDVFIKRPRRKHAWKAGIDCLRPCRPFRAFRMGHELIARHVATALPLACLQRRSGPFLDDSILITEAADGLHLNDFLATWLATPPRRDARLSVPQQRQLAQEVLRQLGVMLQRLHDNNYAHRDLKETNLIVRWSAGSEPEVLLLDLDGLRRMWRITERRRFQGLMRLNVSLLMCPPVNHAGMLRMLLGYLRRPGVGRINFKPYWRVLEVWSASKLKQQIRSQRKRQKAVRMPKS
ncbi:MAG: hypothetical protein EHM48_02900 [Planctomycetaceae bacterium]|nr:MAG: hypothetical protein EHM48_02900 [Planctomycetaceae bacterium]